MLNFPTAYRAHERFRTKVGSPIVKTYVARVSDDGVLDLVEDGEVDLYAQIQSHKDSVDINVLLKRFANGDVDVLSRVQGAYGDFVDMPRTYADMLNRLREAREFFDSLPLETRQKFDCNFDAFITSMDKPDFLERAGLLKKDESPAPAPAETSGGEEK